MARLSKSHCHRVREVKRKKKDQQIRNGGTWMGEMSVTEQIIDKSESLPSYQGRQGRPLTKCVPIFFSTPQHREVKSNLS